MTVFFKPRGLQSLRPGHVRPAGDRCPLSGGIQGTKKADSKAHWPRTTNEKSGTEQDGEHGALRFDFATQLPSPRTFGNDNRPVVWRRVFASASWGLGIRNLSRRYTGDDLGPRGAHPDIDENNRRLRSSCLEDGSQAHRKTFGSCDKSEVAARSFLFSRRHTGNYGSSIGPARVEHGLSELPSVFCIAYRVVSLVDEEADRRPLFARSRPPYMAANSTEPLSLGIEGRGTVFHSERM